MKGSKYIPICESPAPGCPYRGLLLLLQLGPSGPCLSLVLLGSITVPDARASSFIRASAPGERIAPLLRICAGRRASYGLHLLRCLLGVALSS